MRKVYFRRRLPIALFLIISILIYIVYLRTRLEMLGEIIYLCFVLVFSIGMYGSNLYLVNGVVRKYLFFIKLYELEISNISMIELITVKKAGHIYLNIGKGPFEDKCRIITYDKNFYTIDAKYRNSNGEPLGRFLNRFYHKPIKEVEKVKLFYDA